MRPFGIASGRRIARLNRRQRKKLRMGEFQELLFELTLAFNPPLDEPAFDAFCNVLFEFVESQQLTLAGLGGTLPLAESTAMVSHDGCHSVSPAQRDTLLDWLWLQPAVARAEAGELVDGWYGWD